MNICSNDNIHLQKSYHNFMGILVFLEHDLGDGIHWGQRNTDIGFIALLGTIHCNNTELNCGSYARNQMS